MATMHNGQNQLNWARSLLLIALLSPTFYACQEDGSGGATPALNDDFSPSPDTPTPSPSPTRASDQDGDGVSEDWDCNDADPAIFPGAEEVCNGQDEDCDGEIDEGQTTLYYPDNDGDGYGAEEDAIESCDAVEGYILVGGDCDDDDRRINTDATERCDEFDNDCDSRVDEGVTFAFYPDDDGDGYGAEEAAAIIACDAPPETVEDHSDCDDDDSFTFPEAEEVCSQPEKDEDCDGFVDEALGTVFYQDQDGDGAGTEAVSVTVCYQPDGYVAIAGDCDEGDPLVAPAFEEYCDDGRDNNCDGAILPCEPHPDCETGACPTLMGTILDGPQGVGLAGVDITLTPLGSSSTYSVKTNEAGAFKVVALPEGEMSGRIVLDGYESEFLYVDIGPTSQRLWTTALFPTSSSAMGQLRSLVKDASTGQSLEGVRVSLFEGVGVGEMTPAYTLTTTLSGIDQPLNTGNYMAAISLDGYEDISYPVQVRGESIDLKDLALSSLPESNGLRATLTWDSQPKDLDLYLERRAEDGTLIYKVYYDDNAQGGIQLELDDRNGSGPETLTIHQIEDLGSYAFVVRDYSNRNTPESDILGRSGAELIVYQNGQAPLRIPIPAEAGNLWRPLIIEGGVFHSCVEDCVEGE